MADDKIALSIEIEADRAQMSLGELEQGFDGLREKLKATNRGTEEGRKQFKELSTQMAQTSKEIKNIELGFEGLDREQVASELGSVSGAIGDVTASLILMGGENETIEQIGASIEKAMAISMGLKGAIEGLSSANKLYNNLLKQGKVAVIAKSIAEKAAAAGTWILNAANKALNLTLKMNPIGLIVIAVGLAVAAIVYFKDAIWGLIKSALAPFQFAIDAVVDALQWLGIMESDSAKATIKAEEEKAAAVKKASEDKIKEYQKQITELQKLQDAHKRLSDEVIGDMEFEVAMLKAKGENSVKAEWDLLAEKTKVANKAHALIFSEMQAERDRLTLKEKIGEEVTKEEKDRLLKLIDLNHEAFEKTKKADQEIELYRATHNKGVQDRIDKEAAESKKKWEAGAADRAMAASKESQAKKDALMEDIVIGKKVQELQTEELDRHSIHIEGLKTNEELLHDSKNFWHNKDLERIEEERQARLAANQENLQSATQVIGAIGSLNSAALSRDLKRAGDNEALKEKLRKASFEREKKLNIAMALINGAQAQMSILAQTPKADFGVATVIAMVAAAATTIGQIAAIKSTSYQGGGSVAPTPEAPVLPNGAGAGGGGAQITPVTNTSTILGNQQVTVTETDITNTQNNVSVIEESATF